MLIGSFKHGENSFFDILLFSLNSIGPLTLSENGISKLYGVTSFGPDKTESEDCLTSNAVYGRVSESATLKWIKSNTKSFF